MTHNLASATEKVVTTSGLPTVGPAHDPLNHVSSAEESEIRLQLFKVG